MTNRSIHLTGTPVAEGEKRLLRAGSLEVYFDDGSLRWIRWKGVEILRAIMLLVRTPGWGTPAGKISAVEVQEGSNGFSLSYQVQFGTPGEVVRAAVWVKGETKGLLIAEAEIVAELPFDTNRTGFVILHPLDGFAGTEVQVDHASVSSRAVIIPAIISPGQPLMDITAITHHPTAGLTVRTQLEGDVFEMEDHRNWSDASFKTYSRPIGLPYPYKLLPAEPIRQSVTVIVTDSGANTKAASAVAVPQAAGIQLPEYALPLDRLDEAQAALAWPEAMRALAPNWLLLRHDATIEKADADISSLVQLLKLTNARLEVQAILAAGSDDDAEAEIAALARRFGSAGVQVDRLGAFAKIDELSFQPGEPRPPHPSDAAIAASIHMHFPGAVRIGGSPAFFTEFNRKRPDPALWQGLTFATTPTVHAADDASVLETLEALPHILASATLVANGLPLSIGPTGIGARINPYGSSPVSNDPNEREGMAARDPRQRGLFAAAWTVGYLARIAPFAPERFAFGAALGAFGLISTRQDFSRPLWDDLAEGALYPLYHVARYVSAASGGKLIEVDTRNGVARLFWVKDGRQHGLIANLTTKSTAFPTIPIERPLVSLLDAESLQWFATNPEALAPRQRNLPAKLEAFAVVSLAEEGDTE